ncbi:MAG: biotin--[acetyl-CoA-carboxylase] ligase [Oscillospiraceae bacterium]
MKLKDIVLEFLEKHRGEYLSGEQIAEQTGVSRAAVWKAIECLRKDGVNINGVKNKGYTIPLDENSLSAQGIEAILGKTQFDIHTEHTVTSTNTVLKELARNGEKSKYVLVACEQTEGRGRLGRSFYSPDSTGIYMSIILRPDINIEDSLFITTSAAVAVCRAIETVSDGKVSPQIKWVNDIFVDGKKVCGILTEASVDFESGKPEYAVLGIGVNIFPPKNDFPDDIKNTANSIFDSICGTNMRNRMAAEILRELEKMSGNYKSKDILEEYRKRSMLIGKEVYAVSQNQKTPCRVLSIDDNARLVVELENGKQKVLSSGEVSIKF